MYIEPSTNIRILKNVPLDNTYRNTLYFTNDTNGRGIQAHHFMTYTKHNLTEQTYQRVNKGTARVKVKAEDLYDCNYMMFQNTNFGDKWFYAFITSVEYVNNVVSEITFEIDVMQTWFYDCELKASFVEREHSITDNIGDNIVAESVETGEYVYSDYAPLTNVMRDMIVFIAVVDTGDNVVDGNVYDGVYSGTRLKAFLSTDIASINTFLSQFVESTDSVVSMYVAPKMLMPNVEEGGTNVGFKSSGATWVIENGSLNGTEDFNGYVPKNKKLYTYPYNYYHIDNASGSSLSLRYEFFENLKPIIKLEGCITTPVKIIARPCCYKGTPSWNEVSGYADTVLVNEALVMDGYPLCSWNTDSYKAWVAQNNIPLAINAGTSALTGGITGNYMPLVTGVIGSLSQAYSASIKADICKGDIRSGNVNVAHSKQQFYNARVHIRNEFAEIIDRYFHMYGYACKKVKVPNISARPKWNYVKTIDCNIYGSIPSDDLSKIKSVFDSGVTFWKPTTNVGAYTDGDGSLLDNI